MSALEEALADYLQLRRSLGHQMAEAAWLLPSFVAYLDAHGSPTVTIEQRWRGSRKRPQGKRPASGRDG